MDSEYIRSIIRNFEKKVIPSPILDMKKWWDIVDSAQSWAENELMVEMLTTVDYHFMYKDEETIAYDFMLRMEKAMRESNSPEMYLRFATAFQVAEDTLDGIVACRKRKERLYEYRIGG